MLDSPIQLSIQLLIKTLFVQLNFRPCLLVIFPKNFCALPSNRIEEAEI